MAREGYAYGFWAIVVTRYLYLPYREDPDFSAKGCEAFVVICGRGYGNIQPGLSQLCLQGHSADAGSVTIDSGTLACTLTLCLLSRSKMRPVTPLTRGLPFSSRRDLPRASISNSNPLVRRSLYEHSLHHLLLVSARFLNCHYPNPESLSCQGSSARTHLPKVCQFHVPYTGVPSVV